MGGDCKPWGGGGGGEWGDCNHINIVDLSSDYM